MRLLIVRLGSIGDIVHALPALAAARRALPSAEISWAVERQAAEILRDNPFIDRLIEIDAKGLRHRAAFGETLSAMRRQLRRLRVSPFDLTLDFQGLIKSAFIARLSGAPRRYGFGREVLREPQSRFLLTDTVSISPLAHVINKNLLLAAEALKIDVPHDPEDFEFPIGTNETHTREAVETIRAHVHGAGGFAILNPGGNWYTKLWSAEKFGALADFLWTQHNLRSFITFGPAERALAERATNASQFVINRKRDERAAVAVSLSLKGFYELAKRASVYVGGDTGPTHLAIAARTPLVGLYGPTEWWRNGSPRSEDICVERTDIGCRENCNRRACDKWICMDIEVMRVANAVTERLKRASESQTKISAREAVLNA